jgi:hypothetical protein
VADVIVATVVRRAAGLGIGLDLADVATIGEIAAAGPQLIGYWVVDDVGTVINPMLVRVRSWVASPKAWVRC